MPGRNAQPIELLKANGKKHLTKDEIEERKNSEVKLGKTELEKIKPPVFVKEDTTAYKHWKEKIKEYKAAAAEGNELLTSSDVDILAMYCKTYSEYLGLLKDYQRAGEIHYDCRELDESIDAQDPKGDFIFSQKVKKQLRDLFSIGAILSIETYINKKMDMLIKMQDRLFLNMLSRKKNVLQPPKDDKPPSKFGRFGAGVSG